MRLIEVDVIGLLTAQTALDGVEDMFARQPAIVWPRSHWNPAFGGEDDLRPPSFEPLANYGLGPPHGFEIAAHRIAIGSVEEIHALVDGRLHDREAGSLVTLLAEGHRAQTNFRHLEPCAAHAFDFHPISLNPQSRAAMP